MASHCWLRLVRWTSSGNSNPPWPAVVGWQWIHRIAVFWYSNHPFLSGTRGWMLVTVRVFCKSTAWAPHPLLSKPNKWTWIVHPVLAFRAGAKPNEQKYEMSLGYPTTRSQIITWALAYRWLTNPFLNGPIQHKTLQKNLYKSAYMSH